MTPLELALKYMAAFFGEAPLASMKPLLADDLFFRGPFHSFESAKAYLASLGENPPVDVACRILDVYEKENSVCLIYQFSKPGVKTPIAQTFEVRDGKISRIELIFDSKEFA
jgi:N-acetylneuraminic acid mutarotase